MVEAAVGSGRADMQAGGGSMAMFDDAMAALVDGAYAAALDDGWAAWSERVVATLGGSGGAFVVADERTRTLTHAVLHAPVSRAADDYAAGFGALDPQVPAAFAMPASSVFEDTDYRDDSAGTREYLAWLRGTIGLDHHLAIQTPVGDGNTRAVVTILRSVADGVTPTRERERLCAIAPEIRRAVRLGFRHTALLQRSYWEGVAAAGADPALLVDERGRVMRVGDAALALIARNDGIDVVRGAVRCRSPQDEKRVRAVIAGAVASPSFAGAVRVQRRSGRAAYLLVAYPLPRSRRVLAPMEAAALVTIVDPTAAARPRPTLYAQAFGLTPREAEMAEALMAGHSVESAAAALGMSVATARIHLRHLFAKTDTTRQAELVRLLARVPAGNTPFG